MSPGTITEYAHEIIALQDTAGLASPFSERDPDFSINDAYAVALEVLHAREAAGWRRVGRKIGFTNRTIWDQYQVYEPIVGYMYDRTLSLTTTREGSLSLAGMAQPLIEPEIAFRLRSAPPLTDDPVELLDAIEWIGHGFEVVQCHFPDWTFQVADTIADGGLHGQYLLSGGFAVEPGEHQDVINRLATFQIELTRDRVTQATGGGALVLDSPLNALAYLVRTLASLPDHPPLEAGEIITTGTLTTALSAQPGQTWETRIEGLPIPGLRVHFT